MKIVYCHYGSGGLNGQSQNRRGEPLDIDLFGWVAIWQFLSMKPAGSGRIRLTVLRRNAAGARTERATSKVYRALPPRSVRHSQA